VLNHEDHNTDDCTEEGDGIGGIPGIVHVQVGNVRGFVHFRGEAWHTTVHWALETHQNGSIEPGVKISWKTRV